MGLYVSLDAPSILSVAMVLAHAVLPKENWLAERSLDVSWPIAGIPNLLHLDNGPEFDSASLIRGAQEYGIEIEHRPVMKPHFGGHIECLIGTVMGAVHLLPGTTFSNSTEKADYPSESAALLTLSELERWLTLQIAGVYHHSVHSALHCPPIDAWQDGLARRSNASRLPSDHEQFFRDFLPGELRLVRRDGIPVQLAISPMMPNDPDHFAALADEAADRVIVDSYFAGDGSGGRRSRALGIGELYARLGYEGWFRPGAEDRLLDAMRKRLGSHRVLYSREGFSAV